MWLVTNTTEYAADASWVQDKDAHQIRLTVVKATFDILPDGSCQLAKEQVPVFQTPVHEGAPGESSLLYEADLLGLKTGTDILVRGHAWVTNGQPARTVDVQMSVGPVHKRLRVFGDRIWERSVGGVNASPPQAFVSMALNYERAFGGWDRSAPDPDVHRMESRTHVGTGFAISAEGCADQLLPNVEYPNQLINSWKDRPTPAGLNAIECHWSPRRELAGTYDDHWLKHRKPLWAEDFNPDYHNCAPPDQQSKTYLRGGEAVRLINLSRDGEVAFTLPRIYPFFESRFRRATVEHRPQLCTVVLETDLPRLILVFQTSLVCDRRVDDLDETFVSEKQVL
jgi:hypothetical protein